METLEMLTLTVDYRDANKDGSYYTCNVLPAAWEWITEYSSDGFVHDLLIKAAHECDTFESFVETVKYYSEDVTCWEHSTYTLMSCLRLYWDDIAEILSDAGFPTSYELTALCRPVWVAAQIVFEQAYDSLTNNN